VSPILVRPVREQFEHDRIIRVLQARYKRKYEVAINPGAEQNASVDVGEIAMYPDLLLYSQERGRKLQGTIEVETTESVNTLEAMAEWGPFSRLRVPFFLYVPPASIDTVRRLCAEHEVVATEIWTYHTAADQVRFTMVHRVPEIAVAKPRPVATVETKTPVKTAGVREAPPRHAAKPARRAEPAKKAAKPRAGKAAKSAPKPASKKAAKGAKRR
jgi:hypothetical protein